MVSLKAAGRGFTLVEFLVTLTILGMTLVSVVPMGVTWLDNSRVYSAHASLQNGFSAARSLALQNPGRSTLGAAAAVLCVDTSGAVTVYAGSACTGSGTPVWQGSLPVGVQLTLGGAGVPRCITFSNAGLPVTGGTGCTTNVTFSLSKGQASAANKTLY